RIVARAHAPAGAFRILEHGLLGVERAPLRLSVAETGEPLVGVAAREDVILMNAGQEERGGLVHTELEVALRDIEALRPDEVGIDVLIGRAVIVAAVIEEGRDDEVVLAPPAPRRDFPSGGVIGRTDEPDVAIVVPWIRNFALVRKLVRVPITAQVGIVRDDPRVEYALHTDRAPGLSGELRGIFGVLAAPHVVSARVVPVAPD